MKKISPSSMNTFFMCPRKWYFGKNDYKHIEVETIAADFGSHIHELITRFFKTISKIPSPKEIKNKVESIRKKNFDSQTFKSMKKRAEKIFKNFEKFELKRFKEWKNYEPTFVEKELENNEFLGIVDFYGNKIVIDWKTSKYPNLNDSHIRQGAVYSELLNEKGWEVEKVLFIFLESGKVLEMPRVVDGWIYKEREKMLEMIEKTHFPPRRNNLCDKFCEFRLSCDFFNDCLWCV